MKRNLELIRGLLLRIEALPIGRGGPVEQFLSLSPATAPLCGEEDDPDEVHYNMRLLAEGGFIDLAGKQFPGGFNVRGLTWAGHDFLDSVRDENVWKRTREGALQAGGFTFDLLKDIAKGFIKKQFEDRTGIKL